MIASNDPSQTGHRLHFSPSQPHSYADKTGREGLQEDPAHFDINNTCTSKKIRRSKSCAAPATGAVVAQYRRSCSLFQLNSY